VSPSEPRRRGGSQYSPRPADWRVGDGAPWPTPAPALSADHVADRVAARPYDGSFEPTFEGARPSAVLVVLADGEEGAEVLLTRRSMHLSSHRGEVSFPGGRVDPGEGYEAAALREAHEEVGLHPSGVRQVGHLAPISTLVSRSWIVPVVARVPEPLPLVGETDEVDRVLWVPLRDLTLPGTFREEYWRMGDVERPLYFFELDDETVWGATARMLHELLRVALDLHDTDIEGPEPPAR